MNKIQEVNLTNRGRGRPKGAVNKTTAAAKEVIAEAAEKLGGAKRLIAWAKEDAANEKVFWGSIYPKLLPLAVTGADGGAIKVEATVSPADRLRKLMGDIAEPG